ncbi:MAG: hypothetical protein IPJ88_10370 [Myxococcales bacterium]|nr:MAG: hypothetical protein IPJ88_10370 [Myxococcales bacterium]
MFFLDRRQTLFMFRSRLLSLALVLSTLAMACSAYTNDTQRSSDAVNSQKSRQKSEEQVKHAISLALRRTGWFDALEAFPDEQSVADHNIQDFLPNFSIANILTREGRKDLVLWVVEHASPVYQPIFVQQHQQQLADGTLSIDELIDANTPSACQLLFALQQGLSQGQDTAIGRLLSTTPSFSLRYCASADSNPEKKTLSAKQNLIVDPISLTVEAVLLILAAAIALIAVAALLLYETAQLAPVFLAFLQDLSHTLFAQEVTLEEQFQAWHIHYQAVQSIPEPSDADYESLKTDMGKTLVDLKAALEDLRAQLLLCDEDDRACLEAAREAISILLAKIQVFIGAILELLDGNLPSWFAEALSDIGYELCQAVDRFLNSLRNYVNGSPGTDVYDVFITDLIGVLPEGPLETLALIQDLSCPNFAYKLTNGQE